MNRDPIEDCVMVGTSSTGVEWSGNVSPAESHRWTYHLDATMVFTDRNTTDQHPMSSHLLAVLAEVHVDRPFLERPQWLSSTQDLC